MGAGRVGWRGQGSEKRIVAVYAAGPTRPIARTRPPRIPVRRRSRAGVTADRHAPTVPARNLAALRPRRAGRPGACVLCCVHAVHRGSCRTADVPTGGPWPSPGRSEHAPDAPAIERSDHERLRPAGVAERLGPEPSAVGRGHRGWSATPTTAPASAGPPWPRWRGACKLSVRTVRQALGELREMQVVAGRPSPAAAPGPTATGCGTDRAPQPADDPADPPPPPDPGAPAPIPAPAHRRPDHRPPARRRPPTGTARHAHRHGDARPPARWCSPPARCRSVAGRCVHPNHPTTFIQPPPTTVAGRRAERAGRGGLRRPRPGPAVRPTPRARVPGPSAGTAGTVSMGWMVVVGLFGMEVVAVVVLRGIWARSGEGLAVAGRARGRGLGASGRQRARGAVGLRAGRGARGGQEPRGPGGGPAGAAGERPPADWRPAGQRPQGQGLSLQDLEAQRRAAGEAGPTRPSSGPSAR
ncbi:MAG: hypothetical protein KatS3mg103_0389 [Phycisphaerales bacterium]|nr:MAG: hypothetical protein KatS3mg103_0389 [Phycisphaerales bacterium]